MRQMLSKVIQRLKEPYLLDFRYRMHRWANADRALSYEKWVSLIVNARYTVWKVLVNYTPWKPLNWSILRPRGVLLFLRFLLAEGKQAFHSMTPEKRNTIKGILDVLVVCLTTFLFTIIIVCGSHHFAGTEWNTYSVIALMVMFLFVYHAYTRPY